MSKWFGQIGFVDNSMVRPGVYMPDKIIEKDYYGEVKNLYQRSENNPDSVIDNINASCEISILADQFINGNISRMKYATYLGQKWKITKISSEYPRLFLTLGGLYNGK